MSDRGYLIPGASTTSHATEYMTLQLEDEPWMDDAACALIDPDMFFPDNGGRGSIDAQKAKKVCRGCDVRTRCLEYALTHGEDIGIWGGLSSRERRAIRRQRDAGVG